MEQSIPYHTYTKEDIYRYLRNEMSSMEMYALEKQALEDPFLADAIDGYNNINELEANLDIDFLHNSIPKPEAKVVQMPMFKKAFPWKKLAIAASIIGVVVIIGVNYLGKKNKDVELANNTLPNAATSNTELNTTITKDTLITNSNNTTLKTSTPEIASIPKPTVFVKPDAIEGFYKNKLEDAIIPEISNVNAPVVDTAQLSLKKKTEPNTPSTIEKKEEIAMQEAAPSLKPAAPVYNNNVESNRDSRSQNAVQNNRASSKEDNKYNDKDVQRNRAIAVNNNPKNYRFNYKVMDAQGNSIPFTNITVPADLLTTYSRVDGSFGLFSTDSVLNINIKAAGFIPQNLQLASNIGYNNIILKEVANSQSEIVVANSAQKSVTKAKIVAVIEDVEPADGYNNYDNYIANNIDDFGKPKGEVVLSFDVDKNGDPKNITINKSLGEKADKEATRLLEQGPKWKAKKRKNNKGKIVIKF
jgi:hypothetical protein